MKAKFCISKKKVKSAYISVKSFLKRAKPHLVQIVKTVSDISRQSPRKKATQKLSIEKKPTLVSIAKVL